MLKVKSIKKYVAVATPNCHRNRKKFPKLDYNFFSDKIFLSHLKKNSVFEQE